MHRTEIDEHSRCEYKESNGEDDQDVPSMAAKTYNASRVTNDRRRYFQEQCATCAPPVCIALQKKKKNHCRIIEDKRKTNGPISNKSTWWIAHELPT